MKQWLILVFCSLLAVLMVMGCGGDGSSDNSNDDGYDPHESPENLAHAVYDLYRSGESLTCGSDLYLPQDVLEELFSDSEKFCNVTWCDHNNFLYEAISDDDVVEFQKWRPQGGGDMQTTSGSAGTLEYLEGGGVYVKTDESTGEFPLHKIVLYNEKWYVLELVRNRDEVCS